MAMKLKGQEKHERLCRLQLTPHLPMKHFNLKTTNYIYVEGFDGILFLETMLK